MTTIDYTKVLQALKWLQVETGSLACLGCEYEEQCSTRGCAILRNAVEHMDDLERALRSSESARTDLWKHLAATKKMNAELTEAQATMVREFTEKLEELAQVKEERDAALSGKGGEG